MIKRNAANRAGITLTEILISIMIMGIGLVSLATLFPLGLMRLREAQRYSRSGFLVETAGNDAGTRNLFDPATFTNSWYSGFGTFGALAYSPFSNDPAPGYMTTGINTPVGPSRTDGPGLPVAYDPLWWSVIHQFTSQPNLGVGPGAVALTPFTADAIGAPLGTVVSRFGSGLGFVRPDPNPPNGFGNTASAYGLQRVTNFIPDTLQVGVFSNWQYIYPQFPLVSTTPDMPGDIFTSRDDIVMQNDQGNQINPVQGFGSPLVPAMIFNAAGAPVGYSNDWAFSWMFTGRVSDVKDGTIYDGDIVIFQNRPMGLETVNSPFGGSLTVPEGERVVEAVYGFNPLGAVPGRGNRTVLLRWPASQADPDVRVGSWICDVTYERIAGAGANEQRCYWYQVAKRSSVSPSAYSNDPVPHNQLTVTVTAPLTRTTQLFVAASGQYEPLHVNVALLCPSVINVFARTIYVR